MSVITKLRAINKKAYLYLRRLNNKKVTVNSKKPYVKGYELTKEQIKQIKEFYKPYTKKVNLIFHKYYCNIRDDFSVNYLPDDFYYGWIDTYFNDHQEALVFGNKCLYKKYFPFLNHPETVARRINGFWFKGDEENIISFDNIVNYISENTPCFIKRAVDCGGGEGVFYCDKENLEENIERISNIKEDIIIQKAIKQNAELNKIYNESVNTIRIVSLLKDNEVKIYGTVLRMGVDGSKVDNTSSGGAIVEIKENGELNDYAFSKSGKMYEHPNTHTKFKGFVVPSFNEIKEAVKRAHPCMPMFKLISWDFAVGENGEPIFVEANLSSGGCNIIQLASGPFFREDTKEILDMIFNKK